MSSKVHCRGVTRKGEGDWPCTYAAVFRVEWMTNPSGIPGLGVLNKRTACAHHLTQLVRAAGGRHVHVLPVDSELIWWRS